MRMFNKEELVKVCPPPFLPSLMRGQKLIDGATLKHLITKYFQNIHFF